MRHLTVTIGLTLALLLGSVGEGFVLPACPGKYNNHTWLDRFGTFTWGFSSKWAGDKYVSEWNRGCLSRKTPLSMVFKMILSTKAKWRNFEGSRQLAEVVKGVEFKDDIKQIRHTA